MCAFLSLALLSMGALHRSICSQERRKAPSAVLMLTRRLRRL